MGPARGTDRRRHLKQSSRTPEPIAPVARTPCAHRRYVWRRSPEAVSVISDSVFAGHCDRSCESQNQKNVAIPKVFDLQPFTHRFEHFRHSNAP